MKTKSRFPSHKVRRRDPRRGERGAALVLAILVLTILTVIGIALMLVTSTESRIAANEWSVNRGFYASDAGIRWAAVEANYRATDLLHRPEFAGTPFGSVMFNLPSHRNGTQGFFAGDTAAGTDDIQLRVQAPSLVGRRFARASVTNVEANKQQYMYTFEVRSTAAENDAFLQYSKSLVADVEIGPILGNGYPF
jgi:Tfp pilus assembly protein PilX